MMMMIYIVMYKFATIVDSNTLFSSYFKTLWEVKYSSQLNYQLNSISIHKFWQLSKLLFKPLCYLFLYPHKIHPLLFSYYILPNANIQHDSKIQLRVHCGYKLWIYKLIDYKIGYNIKIRRRRWNVMYGKATGSG